MSIPPISSNQPIEPSDNNPPQNAREIIAANFAQEIAEMLDQAKNDLPPPKGPTHK